MRAADSRPLMALSIAIALTLAASAAPWVKEAAGPVPPPPAPSPIEGGRFEASGVVHVPGSDGVLFVDDGRDDAVFWMRLDPQGRQIGAAQPVPLGVRVPDLEGITTDGAWYYAVGSQSKRASRGAAGLVRFRFDPAGRSARGVESVAGLRELLTGRLDRVSRAAGGRDDGLNIEGLAWDSASGRLLLGLRAPLVNGHAVVIPVAVPRGSAFSADALVVDAATVMALPLDGGGIRSLEFDAKAGAFALISADAADGDSQPFRLWEWKLSEAPRPIATLPPRQKAEGVARVAGAGDFRLLVFDTSAYAVIAD